MNTKYYLFFISAVLSFTCIHPLERTALVTSLAHNTIQRHPNYSIDKQTPQQKKKPKRRCKSCEGKKRPLSIDLEERFRKNIPLWSINRTETHKITRIYTFKDFKTAMSFINKVAELAEYEGHHPDIQVRSYNQVYIELYTHAISGLSKNDFYVAESIDDIWYNEFSQNNYIP